MERPALSSPPIAILSALISSPMYLNPTGVFVQLDVQVLGDCIHQVVVATDLRRCFSSRGFHQIFKQQSDNVIGLNKTASWSTMPKRSASPSVEIPICAPVPRIFVRIRKVDDHRLGRVTTDPKHVAMAWTVATVIPASRKTSSE